MGITSAFKSLTRGDFSDSFGYLWVPESEIARSNEADSKLAEIIANDAARGIISAEQAQEAYGRIAQNAFQPGGILSQPGTNVTKGFLEGAGDGADAIRKGVGNTINGVFGLVTRLVPWQLWLVGLAVVAVWAWPFAGPFIVTTGKRLISNVRGK